MANDILQTSVTTPGDIVIAEAVIVASTGYEIDIRAHIGELNFFEDMYRTGLYGNLLIIDSINLGNALNLQGDEYIRIKAYTPGLKGIIHKTFKVYSITDRMMLTDTGKQSYVLHFCSTEIFIDALSPIYKTFSGKTDEIAAQIFDSYLATSRNGDGQYTNLYVLGQTENNVKFTSPGWRPMKCINWLASRSLEAGYKSPAYLFYETMQGFYFANVEHLIDLSASSKRIYSEYFYRANNLTGDRESLSYVKDVDFEYKICEEMKVIETFNGLRNSQTGYLANRTYTFDLTSKEYAVTDYDHAAEWFNYKHLEDIGGASRPPFLNSNQGALRSPAGYNMVYVQHSDLYTGFKNNANEIIDQIAPRRTSALNELTNLKLEITVPGKTDIEVGSIIYFHYPNASPKDQTDLTKDNDDKLYSGYYLVTAVRHKMTLLKHMMILEVVKDSYKGN